MDVPLVDLDFTKQKSDWTWNILFVVWCWMNGDRGVSVEILILQGSLVLPLTNEIHVSLLKPLLKRRC